MKKYDLIVIGGGLTGVAAAVAKNTGANTHTVDIPTIQDILRRNGAAID